MTPRQPYNWAKVSIPNIHFEYSSIKDYKKKSEKLHQRFLSSQTIPGTRKYHSFVPVSKDKVKISFYSSSVISKEEIVIYTVAHNGLSLESIRGFVTCASDGKWWLGCVIEIFQEEDSAKLTFLHPHGHSNTFKYPASPDIRIIATHNILSTTGRVYTLTKKDITVNEKFRQAPVH